MFAGEENNVRRSDLLRGRIRTNPTAIRPPWALQESDFTEQCTRCGDCAESCPEHIILTGPDGLPVVDFAKGECTFCKACLHICAAGALVFDACQAPWSLKADITPDCLSVRGIMCRTCMECCEPRAITFHLATAGRALPVIDSSACTGCGACVAPCPVEAINVQSVIQPANTNYGKGTPT